MQRFTCLHCYANIFHTLQGPVGLLSTKPFHVTYFFDYRKQPSFSLQDLPWVSVGRFKQLSVRDWRGMWDQGERKSRAALGQVPFPHQWKPTTTSLSSFVDTETPSRWEKLWYAAHKQVDPRTVKSEGWQCWLLLISRIHQKNIHKPITPSFTIKPVTIFPKLRHMVLRH